MIIFIPALKKDFQIKVKSERQNFNIKYSYFEFVHRKLSSVRNEAPSSENVISRIGSKNLFQKIDKVDRLEKRGGD